MKHFEFGENWVDYSNLIGTKELIASMEKLDNLIGIENIEGKTVLDIGSGSGIHSLSFLKLGAQNVEAFDYDLNSVRTTSEVILKHWSNMNWSSSFGDILSYDLNLKRYDLVYSWGVLHHTGDLDLALKNASKLVSENGLFVVALYKKTPMCGIWKIEKYLYTHSGQKIREVFLQIYKTFFKLGLAIRGKSYQEHSESYSSKRGMTLENDMIDWLGGYPYESISEKEVIRLLKIQGFDLIDSKPSTARTGILGSGCSEFVFRRI
jgi:2-polyprenyl-6-hydroxyphenyl methylase/3-demethylubiquinone-9 3-methyltransferase